MGDFATRRTQENYLGYINCEWQEEWPVIVVVPPSTHRHNRDNNTSHGSPSCLSPVGRGHSLLPALYVCLDGRHEGSEGLLKLQSHNLGKPRGLEWVASQRRDHSLRSKYPVESSDQPIILIH